MLFPPPSLQKPTEIALAMPHSTNAPISSPNSLRIPEHSSGIHNLLDGQQLLIRRVAVVFRMRLRSRQAWVDVIEIAAEDGGGHLAFQRGVEAVDEVCGRGGEGRVGVAREAVVLDDPERGAVAVGGAAGGGDVDLGIGAAV